VRRQNIVSRPADHARWRQAHRVQTPGTSMHLTRAHYKACVWQLSPADHGI